MITTALERIIQRAASPSPAAERCDLCGEALAAEHRHLFDSGSTEVLCACQACTILFDRKAASNGHYRLVPRRRTRLPEVDTESLGVPVGLAFFVARSSDGRVIAHYPSPLGTTEWDVDKHAWDELLSRYRQLRDIEPDVQALLVNTAWGAHEHWLVSLDDCYRLVAIVRREWKGLSGGGTVWPQINQFFAELTERSE